MALNTLKFEQSSSAFKLGGDPTRFRIVVLLADGPRNVSDLCDSMEQTQPAISHHLALLRVSGFIASRRDGKHNVYELTDKGHRMIKAAQLLMD